LSPVVDVVADDEEFLRLERKVEAEGRSMGSREISRIVLATR
jgi:hypothetical protein